MAKTIGGLLDGVDGVIAVPGDTDAPITAPIVESSASVEPGGVFVARRGLSFDGHAFIADAIARGAAAIVGERPLNEIAPDGLAVPYVQVENAGEIVGWLAAAYHDYPSRKLIVIGITGTDGKTSTSTMLYHILRISTNERAGMISTIAAYIGGDRLDTGLHVTTPGAPQIQAILARMVDAGLRMVVLEATSHGLAQGRLNGVDFDVAAFTNVTHEHLDYHGTFEAYRAAKGRLFAMLGTSARKPRQPKVSIINGDDASAATFAAFPADRRAVYHGEAPATPEVDSVHTVPAKGEVDDVHHVDSVHVSPSPSSDAYRARDVRYDQDGTHFMLESGGERTPIHIPLIGGFHVANALAAAACARAVGASWDAIRDGIARVPGISGRMERIDEGQHFLAIVDFAHTPNALANALSTARRYADKRLICVFGCAGLRDREKRILMPRIAIEFADLSLFTAEDPRTEPLDEILATMADAACEAGGVEGETFMVIPDRGEAILHAMSHAAKGDVVIVCGKGHERSMAFGTEEVAWDDRDAVRAALQGDRAALAVLPTAKHK